MWRCQYSWKGDYQGAGSLPQVIIRTHQHISNCFPLFRRNQMLVDCGFTAFTKQGKGSQEHPQMIGRVENHPDLMLSNMTQVKSISKGIIWDLVLTFTGNWIHWPQEQGWQDWLQPVPSWQYTDSDTIPCMCHSSMLWELLCAWWWGYNQTYLETMQGMVTSTHTDLYYLSRLKYFDHVCHVWGIIMNNEKGHVYPDSLVVYCVM